MDERLMNSRVKGFLKAKGKTIVNGDEEEIILSGWGLGNWLLPEGYMWLSHHSKFDRPRRIETVIRNLTGTEYSKRFFKTFRENYITKEDIKRMAEEGYNSVRIPFSWRNLMEDEPGLTWKEEGFELIDRCIDWCEEYSVYAFLDMHGAPGGQTGANIDDSIDDIPRLFLDEDSWSKGISLWRKIADRYKNRYIVGGYDLLNEPIRPKNEIGDYDYLVPKLVQFYEEAIKAIREVDQNHMLSIEGHHWATNTEVFHKKYDDNMVIHFHRYACLPDVTAFTEWLELSEKLDAPLWLGETGENLPEWYTALYPLAVSLGIGYNVWPFKKMNCTNSPYSIKEPAGWSKFLAYTKGEVKLEQEEAKKILDNYLENIKIENCNYNKAVNNSVLRIPKCSVRATDFDELPGKGQSYSGTRLNYNDTGYRTKTNMCIKEDDNYVKEQRFYFDSMWDRFLLNLSGGEFATYSINNLKEDNSLSIEYSCKTSASISIYQNEDILTTLHLDPIKEKMITQPIPLRMSNQTTIKIVVNKGSIDLIRLNFN